MGTAVRTPTPFMMPSLGADMTEGTITEWLVQPGEQVERGQIVVIVETDKSDIDVEVFDAGVITEILVREGDRVPVGTTIAMIDVAPGATGTPTMAPATPAAAPVAATARASEPTVDDEPASHVTSPVVRHLADRLHVDLTTVHGSGPGGRVHRDDVLAAADTARSAPQAPAPRPVGRRGGPRVTPRARRLLAEHGLRVSDIDRAGVIGGDDVLAHVAARANARPTRTSRRGRAEQGAASAMRRHIAELMTKSWQEIPHYHVTKRLDLSVMSEQLAAYNEERPIAARVVPGAVLLAAAARAAATVPACNGWWRDGRFEPANGVALGVVLSLRTGGLIVPTIEHAETLTVAETMTRLTELVQRARQGRLRASDLAPASVTVTILGDLGADAVAGVIHPPQVALLGLGAVHDEVWPVDGGAVVRPTVHADLAGDHRAIDGSTGSRLLTQMQTQLNTIAWETP